MTCPQGCVLRAREGRPRAGTSQRTRKPKAQCVPRLQPVSQQPRTHASVSLAHAWRRWFALASSGRLDPEHQARAKAVGREHAMLCATRARESRSTAAHPRTQSGEPLRARTVVTLALACRRPARTRPWLYAGKGLAKTACPTTKPAQSEPTAASAPSSAVASRHLAVGPATTCPAGCAGWAGARLDGAAKVVDGVHGRGFSLAPPARLPCRRRGHPHDLPGVSSVRAGTTACATYPKGAKSAGRRPRAKARQRRAVG